MERTTLKLVADIYIYINKTILTITIMVTDAATDGTFVKLFYRSKDFHLPLRLLQQKDTSLPFLFCGLLEQSKKATIAQTKYLNIDNFISSK
jgi:hypothetical protein